MTTRLAGLILALACALSAGCSSTPDTPAGPSLLQGPMTGTWTGTLVREGVTTRVSMTITEYDFLPGRAISMTGTYAASDNESPASTGTLVGFNEGGAVSLTLLPSTRPTCTVTIFGRPGDVFIEGRLEGTSLRGTASQYLCDPVPASTVSLTRQ
jgi:hypothetical protein